MMDASGLYPKGFHPVVKIMSPDVSRVAKVVARRDTRRPVKYYFIDFGISSFVAPEPPRLVLGAACIDRLVPELSSSVPYDPFKVDVFILGHVFKDMILQVSADCHRYQCQLTLLLRIFPTWISFVRWFA